MTDSNRHVCLRRILIGVILKTRQLRAAVASWRIDCVAYRPASRQYSHCNSARIILSVCKIFRIRLSLNYVHFVIRAGIIIKNA